ncbi:ABC transporter ATP-binding protein [Aureimonas mangrovi]|uniref:ABC transporter ATP-binding protein n=1 Tax=Aureimonas mangrovi TaxID=2758041 RepID=UPI00163D9D92|nr:ABC transporter ATP-binding protein [Aureimonas mangrovi]
MQSLKLSNIVKSFGKVEVLKGIDLAVEKGELVVFVGPSGCGKSTLMRIIAGLEMQTEGTVEIAGRNVDAVVPAKRGIAMVFQSYALYPHLDVAGNMSLALKQDGVAKAEREKRVSQAADFLKLAHLLERRPAELSGGQRQRVAIGRAVVREPTLFLFDEPLSNLDAALRVNTRLEIARLHRSLGATMVYVTHDQIEAMTLADRIVVLEAGVVQQVGRPMDLYNKPANIFVAGFIGSPKMNFLAGEAAAERDAHTVGIRPEHVRVDPQGEWLGRVRHAEHLGSDSYLYVTLDGGEEMTVRIPEETTIAVDETVRLAPLPGRVHRFAADGTAL